MQLRVFRTAIESFYTNADIVGASLRVLNKDVEIFIVIKDAGIKQLIFHSAAAASTVFLNKLGIRKLLLRVLVQHLHVAVSRSVVEVKVIFLYIFTVIALA